MNNQTAPNNTRPIRVEAFSSFPVDQVQNFDIFLANHIKPNDLIVTITNPILGVLDRQLDWIQSQQQATSNNKCCRASFKAPVVGIYTISVELANQANCLAQFQAKAYDLSKVFITGSSGKCRLNASYEFSVDASEAGEGQLEIAVNEGEIPNQVQVLENGKCIVNFEPENNVPHIVDIKFNGHNVNGCPFVVQIVQNNEDISSSDQVPRILSEPILVKEERILVNGKATFSIQNVRLSKLFDKEDLMIFDPENQTTDYQLSQDIYSGWFKFEFVPTVAGDYTIELKQTCELFKKLTPNILEQFPFPIKVFDFTKVLVTDVTDGVIGHPIYFFIDASQAGSGNLEIRVSSKTRYVPNIPQSEANAKIRVNFTPTEAVEHSIDVKFNGISVPGNPFLVKVAQKPQARLPITSQDILKYVAIDEFVSFYVDYIGQKETSSVDLTNDSCKVYMLRPDFVYSRIDAVELFDQKKFKITFKATKIGPYKLFITVNNELLPSSPFVCNVFNINEVKVFFEGNDNQGNKKKPIGQVNKPITFTVDASRAGEGTLALDVISGITKSSVQTDVEVSEKGHGMYNLTFVPLEFAPHSIDMSFNKRIVPNSPFIVEVVDADGKAYSEKQPQRNNNNNNNVSLESSAKLEQQMIQNFDALNLKQSIGSKSASKSKQQYQAANSSRKSLAFGLVNASNIVYLESGVLENNKNQVNLIGPNNEKVPFIIAKGSPQSGEPKKSYIEYKPKSIGTHTINIVETGNDLREYFVEICDPSLIRIVDINPTDDTFLVGKPVTFCLDTRESGEIQLDSVSIFGPKKANGKIREGDQTILGRIKSISSSSSSYSQTNLPIEYSIERISESKQEIKFVPIVAGKHTIDIRCLGQPVSFSPFEIEVKNQQQAYDSSTLSNMTKSNKSLMRDEELLRTIVVHGVSLKCTPVNKTGAFIIETNKLAQARDFDVLITDPNNSLVDVQCYLQQDGNLLAEWTPKRIGTHKIEVLYKDKQVPSSPFVTEAFDPSGVIIENLKGTLFNVNDKIEFKLNRREAGYGELDVAITSPVGRDLPIDVVQGDDSEIISFTPTVAGKYEMSITFSGYDVPKSPITFTARDERESLKVSGTGLRCAEINRTAQFVVDSATDGELKFRIECGDREIVPKVDKRGNSYTIKYKPTEVGNATISLYWNGTQLEGSPYSVPVNDLSKILFLSGTNKSSNTNNQRIIDYEPNQAKEITVDTSKCGPGDLKAEAYCRANPNLKFSLLVTQYVLNRYKLVFVCPPKPDQLPKGANVKDFSAEATYMIRFYYNNLFVPENQASVVVSPLFPIQQEHVRESSLGRTRRNESIERPNNIEQNNNNSKPQDVFIPKSNHLKEKNGLDCPIVALRGHGLAEAKCGERAEFTIDGSQAGFGKPEVKFSSEDDTHITVKLEQLEDKIYRASYIAQATGIFTLNVLWDGKQVAGCPISVNILGNCDSSRVICTGDGLKGGVLGEEIKTFIDTRRAGPGELTALCTGPQKVAFCELLDRGDGTFILYIKPQEPGRHSLTIKYGGQHIPKSPFLIKVSGKPDPSKVRVHGPGVEHGVLSLYQSRFVCDTRGAGAGQLTVRIRGPKGAFRMETQRESQKDRTILCKYDPTEPGDYRIEIKWSGRHVPGSPFSVMIFDTQEELNRFLATQHHNSSGSSSTSKPALHQQVPYHPSMVDYGHYSMVQPNNQQPPFRLQ